MSWLPALGAWELSFPIEWALEIHEIQWDWSSSMKLSSISFSVWLPLTAFNHRWESYPSNWYSTEQGFSLPLPHLLIFKLLLPVKHLSLPFQWCDDNKNTQYPKVLCPDSHLLAPFLYVYKMKTKQNKTK